METINKYYLDNGFVAHVQNLNTINRRLTKNYGVIDNILEAINLSLSHKDILKRMQENDWFFNYSEETIDYLILEVKKYIEFSEF